MSDNKYAIIGMVFQLGIGKANGMRIMSPFFLSPCFFYSWDLFFIWSYFAGNPFCFTGFLLYSEGKRLGFHVALSPPISLLYCDFPIPPFTTIRFSLYSSKSFFAFLSLFVSFLGVLLDDP